MRKNKILPSLRLDSETYELVKKSIETFNSSGFEMKLEGFRRLAYRLLATKILSGEDLTLQFKKYNSSTN